MSQFGEPSPPSHARTNPARTPFVAAPAADGIPEEVGAAVSGITIDDIRAAARRLAGVAYRTPVLRFPGLDDLVGAAVFLKCENFQRCGAFKFRGAYNAMSQLSHEQRRRGAVSFSSGNHAQGVALAGKILDIPAAIVMPHDAPAVKVEATRRYGAEIIRYHRYRGNREEIAGRLADERGMALVPSSDHPHVVAGQGTVALELLEDVPDLDLLIVAIGGGGLIAGCSIAAHALRPQMRIIGVEPETANDSYLSLQMGRRVSTAPSDSIADGLLPTAPGVIPFSVMKEHLDRIVLVSDDEIADAVRYLVMQTKIVVEPSGAAPIAALLSGRIANVEGRRIGIVLSGGNIDAAKLAEILSCRVPASTTA
ncbi:MAG: pyridoxal-phosphate dependent enzyme [Acidobacteriota bacterium]